LAPDAMTSTMRPLRAPRKTSDFAICSTRHPRALAASAALRVGWESS
jgi:hypothetical protein